MNKNSKIIDALGQIDDTVSINQLVEICQKIASTYLHYNYKKVFRFLQNEDLSLEEFALDAIAPLFTKENGAQEISLKQSFLKWDPPIYSEEDALYFLNKVVSHRVEQHIFLILGEEDPVFSKILHSVNYLIKTQGYKKIHSFGKTFIVESNYNEDRIGYIDRLEFEQLPSALFNNRKLLLEKIINFIESETNFSPAIPLNDLIYRLKHISISEFITTEASEESRKQFEIDELINYAMTRSIEKLNASYYQKGKLNISETESMRKALKDLCEDLKNGGINPGLYNYLLPHMDSLTKEAYQQNYHNILEYLFKITKSIIAEKIKEKR
jgi:hypothetical protein